MIKPVGHFVLVEPQEVEEKTVGGILLPQDVIEKQQVAVMQGEIIAVGEQSEFIKADDIGSMALFGRYAGTLVEHGGKKYRLIDNADIKGIAHGE